MGQDIRIVTDSGADLPLELAAELGITVVPLAIHFDDEVYKDGVDLSTQEFYQRLKSADELPKTSQPAPGAFAEAYRKLAAEGASTIISVHLSGKLSGTLQSARMAAELVDDVEVIPVDTKAASLGIGIMAVEAARKARQGASREEILSLLDQLVDNLGVYFIVDTLEYLQKNGRIGKAQAILGGMLRIKPILTLEDGVVSAVEKVRGKQRALSRTIDMIRRDVGDKPVTFVLSHADVPDAAEKVADSLRQQFEVRELITSYIGPTIGVHVGPGTIAILFHTV